MVGVADETPTITPHRRALFGPSPCGRPVPRRAAGRSSVPLDLGRSKRCGMGAGAAALAGETGASAGRFLCRGRPCPRRTGQRQRDGRCGCGQHRRSQDPDPHWDPCHSENHVNLSCSGCPYSASITSTTWPPCVLSCIDQRREFRRYQKSDAITSTRSTRTAPLPVGVETRSRTLTCGSVARARPGGGGRMHFRQAQGDGGLGPVLERRRPGRQDRAGRLGHAVGDVYRVKIGCWPVLREYLGRPVSQGRMRWPVQVLPRPLLAARYGPAQRGTDRPDSEEAGQV